MKRFISDTLDNYKGNNLRLSLYWPVELSLCTHEPQGLLGMDVVKENHFQLYNYF